MIIPFKLRLKMKVPKTTLAFLKNSPFHPKLDSNNAGSFVLKFLHFIYHILSFSSKLIAIQLIVPTLCNKSFTQPNVQSPLSASFNIPGFLLLTIYIYIFPANSTWHKFIFAAAPES